MSSEVVLLYPFRPSGLEPESSKDFVFHAMEDGGSYRHELCLKANLF